MSSIRPLSKDLLKKMFLKVLLDQKDSTDALLYTDFVSLICDQISEHFEIPELMDEEYELCLDAVYELEKEGMIVNNEESEILIDLTPKGLEYAKNKLAYFKLPDSRIYNHVTRTDLRDEVVKEYLSGNYEESIKKAFKLLEDKVKENIVPKPADLEEEEVSNYYITKEGQLKYTNFDHSEELSSLRRIMAGTMLWYKDPESDITVSYNNAEAAAQILVFANMHLNLIEQ